MKDYFPFKNFFTKTGWIKSPKNNQKWVKKIGEKIIME